MDATRIERALRQGPPEPRYRGTSIELVLAGANRWRWSPLTAMTRLGSGLVAAVFVVAAGALLLMLLVRPPGTTSVGGPGLSSPTPLLVAESGPLAPNTSISPATSVPDGSTFPVQGGSPPTPIDPGVGSKCDLLWSLGPSEGAAGSRYIAFEAVNAGPASCLSGTTFGVTLLDADGTVLVTVDSPNGQQIEVLPKEQVTGFSQWSNWCGSPPPTPLTLTIHPDGTVKLDPLDVEPPLCTAPGKPSQLTPLELKSAP